MVGRSGRRWLAGGLVALVLIGTGLILLWHWENGSSVGNVHVGTPASPTRPAAQPLVLKTDYFTTVLPAGFALKRQTATPDGAATLLQLVADTASQTDEQFAATVGMLPMGGFAGVGDYHLRSSQPATYPPCTVPSLPSGATAFCTSGGPAAFTVFWPHGAQYVELALSTDGGASSAELQTVFTQAMGSWQWR